MQRLARASSSGGLRERLGRRDNDMLKNLDPLLVPRLIYHLAAMGHGDEIAVVDRNYPAHAAGPEVVDLPGAGVTVAMAAILSVLPLDTFVDCPVMYMEPVTGEGQLPVHQEIVDLATRFEGRAIGATGLPREAFYRRARDARAVVATTEARPYGCFLLIKGVIG
jgi:L-fucose mutarotase